MELVERGEERRNEVSAMKGKRAFEEITTMQRKKERRGMRCTMLVEGREVHLGQSR